MSVFEKIWRSVWCLVWRIVLWGKGRCGFVRLGDVQGATGYVVWTDGGVNADGDFTFDLVPDPEFAFLKFYGDRETLRGGGFPGSVHIEVMPCDQPGAISLEDRKYIIDTVAAGGRVRVRVSGQWSFDGVHLGLPMWKEILSCIWGHGPNEKDGWTEIHPATRVEILR
jgi:hypothetical protein